MALYPKFKKHRSFFFENTAPLPHKGWTLAAFQQFCRSEMEAAGFDLTKRVCCSYSPLSVFVTFCQEPNDFFYPWSPN